MIKCVIQIHILDRYFDFINLMAYDLHGNWEANTGFNAPLYSRSDESAEESKLNVVSVSLSLSLWCCFVLAVNDVM